MDFNIPLCLNILVNLLYCRLNSGIVFINSSFVADPEISTESRYGQQAARIYRACVTKHFNAGIDV